MKNFYKLGLFLSIFIGANANAEGGCPAGSYPIGGGNAGWQGCAPIPGYNSGGGQSYSRPGRWLDSYGALVFGYDKQDGSIKYAFSRKHNTEDKAINGALNACYNANFDKCSKATSFWNVYLVIASSEDGALSWAYDKKMKTAKKNAIKECGKNGAKNCKAIEIVDSSADWVQ